MEKNSTDVIIKTENLINAVQNERSIWNSELNSSEEEKEMAWTRIAGVLQYSKSKLIFIATSRLEQAAMTTPSSTTSAMFTYL